MAQELGILGSEFFTQVILPFVLVFTLIFAILEKSKILGDGKRQINSIVSLAMALILIGVPLARGVITDIVPVISVVAVVILVFLLLYGFVGGTERGLLNRPLQIVVGVIAAIVIIVTLMISTGVLPKIVDFVKGNPSSSQLLQTLFFLVVIVISFVVMLSGGKSDKKSE